MKREIYYAVPECQALELIEEGVLCTSESKDGRNESWTKDDDYSIFNF